MHQMWVCRDIEHLGSLESTEKARIALGCASSNSYASFVLSKLPACSISRLDLLTSRAQIFHEREARVSMLQNFIRSKLRAL